MLRFITKVFLFVNFHIVITPLILQRVYFYEKQRKKTANVFFLAKKADLKSCANFHTSKTFTGK